MKYIIKLTDGTTRQICGVKRHLQLSTGETINVICDERYPNDWYITHFESGLALIPDFYHFIHIVSGTVIAYNPDTIKTALLIAKHTLDTICQQKKTTFNQLLEIRKNELNQWGANV